MLASHFRELKKPARRASCAFSVVNNNLSANLKTKDGSDISVLGTQLVTTNIETLFQSDKMRINLKKYFEAKMHLL